MTISQKFFKISSLNCSRHEDSQSLKSQYLFQWYSPEPECCHHVNWPGWVVRRLRSCREISFRMDESSVTWWLLNPLPHSRHNSSAGSINSKFLRFQNEEKLNQWHQSKDRTLGIRIWLHFCQKFWFLVKGKRFLLLMLFKLRSIFQKFQTASSLFSLYINEITTTVVLTQKLLLMFLHYGFYNFNWID